MYVRIHRDQANVGPKLCVFMKDFLMKMELSEETYGLRSWMDFDLKFGPYVEKGPVNEYLDSMLTKKVNL